MFFKKSHVDVNVTVEFELDSARLFYMCFLGGPRAQQCVACFPPERKAPHALQMIFAHALTQQ
jgi:hypothetical protein